MRLRLLELQNNNIQAKKLRVSKGLSEGWKDVEEVLYPQNLSYISKIIYSKLIYYYYNNPLAGHFEIDKKQELITRKYY